MTKRGNVIEDLFSRTAKQCAVALGHPLAFMAALLIIVLWAMSGPIFGYSDTWQLAINTGTTIVTFLMVFLIQSTQNRDSSTVQVKLAELIRSTQGAHNAMLDLEALTQKDLDHFVMCYQKLAEEARKHVRKGLEDTGTPEVKHQPVNG